MSGDTNNQPLSVARRTTLTLQAAIDRMADRLAERGANDRGASMVEYGLLLVLVLLVAFFTVKIFGDSLVALFDASANTMENAPNVNPEA